MLHFTFHIKIRVMEMLLLTACALIASTFIISLFKNIVKHLLFQTLDLLIL